MLTIKMDMSLGICWFVVDVSYYFTIFIFMRLSKDGCPLKLYSIANFILGCRFWSMLIPKNSNKKGIEITIE